MRLGYLWADRGDLVGLVGSISVDKSTLLKALACRIPRVRLPQYGLWQLIGFRGRQLAQLLAFNQDRYVPFFYTARQAVEMGRHPSLSGWGAPGGDHTVVNQALAGADCLKRADMPVTALSGAGGSR